MAEPGAIDIVVNPHTPLEVANDQVGVDVHFQDKVRMPEAMRKLFKLPERAGAGKPAAAAGTA